MNTLGNVLWFFFGGFLDWLAWMFAGICCCITIVGIPLGLQCFKLATLSLCPFGKDVVYGDGTVSFLANILWLLLFGWEMALANVCIGLCWCITIIGIPFGKQFFKLAKLSLMPFGAKIV